MSGNLSLVKLAHCCTNTGVLTFDHILYGVARFAGEYCSDQNTTVTMKGKFTMVEYSSKCKACRTFGQRARGYTPIIANAKPWNEEKRR